MRTGGGQGQEEGQDVRRAPAACWLRDADATRFLPCRRGARALGPGTACEVARFTGGAELGRRLSP